MPSQTYRLLDQVANASILRADVQGPGILKGQFYMSQSETNLKHHNSLPTHFMGVVTFIWLSLSSISIRDSTCLEHRIIHKGHGSLV